MTIKSPLFVGLFLFLTLVLSTFVYPTQPENAVAGHRDAMINADERCFQGIAPEVGDGDLLLRGELRSNADDPLAGFTVQLLAMTDVVDITGTDAEGMFVFGNLPEGTYTLEVVATDGTPVEILNDSDSTVELEANDEVFPVLYAADSSSAQLAGAPDNSAVTPAQLGEISGTITAEDTTDPLAAVRVTVYDSDGGFVETAFTDATGVYTVTGLQTGNYIVEFDPQTFFSSGGPAQAYLGEFYDNKATEETADPVAVTDPGTTTGIDAALSRGTQISGTVTAQNGGAPLEDVEVNVYDYCTLEFVNDTTTDTSGEYTLSGLPTGSYIVEFDPSSSGASSAYIGEYYNDKVTALQADRIDTTVPTDTPDLDAQLADGGTIAGTVTAADGGASLSGVDVIARTNDGTFIASSRTDSAGEYLITGLLDGNYIAEFSTRFVFGDAEEYLGEYYNEKKTEQEATSITVTAPNTTSGINAELTRGGSISGIITAADTTDPLDDVTVNISSASGGFFKSGSVNAVGEYSIVGLPSGSYIVEFDTFSFSFSTSDSYQYLNEYYSGQRTRDDAEAVTVTAPNDTADINATLDRGGQISGTVTAADTDEPLANVDIDIRSVDGSYSGDADTDEMGMYVSEGLPSGDYIVEFDPSFGDAEVYVGEYYNDQSEAFSADTVSITAPDTTGSINAALARGGTITGTVTLAATGAPLPGTSVRAECELPDGSRFFEFGFTDALGEYVISGLPTSTCTVLFFPPSNRCDRFVDEYYNDKLTEETADNVMVTAPNTTSDINAVIGAGGSISGRVTAQDTGDGLSDIRVIIYNSSGDFIEIEFTDDAGFYTVIGLPVGSYVVEFEPDEDSSAAAYIFEYYNDKTSRSEADLVTVVADEDTGDINAVLARGGRISGTITGEDTGMGINVDAVVYDSDGNEVADVDNDSDTGEYITPGLPSGNYFVEFVPEGSDRSYIREYYNDKPSRDTADPVTITAPDTTTGIDAVLTPGGSISGFVTDSASGNGLEDIDVIIYDASDTQVLSTRTASGGSYETSGLPAGTYRVEFLPGNLMNYNGEFYNNKSSLSEADPVSITAGNVTDNIDAALDVAYDLYLPLVAR